MTRPNFNSEYFEFYILQITQTYREFKMIV